MALKISAHSSLLHNLGTDPIDRRKFSRLQLLRYILAAGAAIFLDKTLDMGIALHWLIAFSLLGVFLAGRFASQGKTFRSMLLKHSIVFGLIWLTLRVSNFFLTRRTQVGAEYDFLIAQLADYTFLVLLFYSLNFLTTWIFWTRQGFATAEAIVYAGSFVWILGGHRNYHLDAPKQVTSLAWKVDFLQRLHAEPQHLFIGLGAIFIVTLTLYLVLSTHRPIFGRPREIRTSGTPRKLLLAIIPTVLLLALGYYTHLLNQRFSADLSKATEGVGQSAKEGQSNLGFHSAVGQTKQPSALVRLEGDYEKNPWAPMLYFREGALSQFNGRELVVAGLSYDLDVPRIAPGQPYVSIIQDSSAGLRSKVIQSIYLLAKHNTPFAIDYPSRISLIKNPDPERFALSYQAASQAPVTKLTELEGKPVGNPQWDAQTREHYLRAPGSLAKSVPAEIQMSSSEAVLDEHGEDLRYLGLSRALTSNHTNPLIRTDEIIKYLSKESIYTRNPGHQVTPQGDPVAPYLFAEKKKGYCVHFAHAAVFMLRLAGIPSRIGTGYLTDLTYAKDGHILLQMGDRHAWPEVYIDGIGWTIVDINPAQAENEQAPIPDEKLLEELMSKIDPAQELLEPTPIDEPTLDTNQLLEQFADARFGIAALTVLFLVFLILKLYLRFAYRLTQDSAKQARLAYVSFASQVTDLGIARQSGETRSEFSSRLQQQHAVNAQAITRVHEVVTYSKGSEKVGGPSDAIGALAQWRSSVDSTKGRWRRILAFFSPRSILKLWKW